MKVTKTPNKPKKIKIKNDTITLPPNGGKPTSNTKLKITRDNPQHICSNKTNKNQFLQPLPIHQTVHINPPLNRRTTPKQDLTH